MNVGPAMSVSLGSIDPMTIDHIYPNKQRVSAYMPLDGRGGSSMSKVSVKWLQICQVLPLVVGIGTNSLTAIMTLIFSDIWCEVSE